MSWAEYLRLARELDRVRRDESERAADRRRAVGAARDEYRELSDRLDAQQGDLTELAYRLRVPAPQFSAAAPQGAPEGSVDQSLAEARRHLDVAEREAERLEERATEPRLLPGWSIRGRNAVVYAASAGCALVFQVVLTVMQGSGNPLTTLSWTFCGLPVIAFFAGYLLVGYLGKPVLVPRAARQPWEDTETKAQLKARQRAQDQAARTPRMGFAICVAMFPVFFLLWTLVTDALSP